MIYFLLLYIRCLMYIPTHMRNNNSAPTHMRASSIFGQENKVEL